MKLLVAIAALTGSFLFYIIPPANVKINRSYTVDSLGACQGAHYQHGKVYLYGDRETGMMRAYIPGKDTLTWTGEEYKLTQDGKDLINHPTGIAWNGVGPTFIGNSIRLNAEGTQWRAVIYSINWEGLLKTHTLDGNVLRVIEDDACIQGARPEYVKYKGKWYVATADYGNHGNEVRLYNPERLAQVSHTKEDGVLFKKFTCGPWVQNLHWIAEKNILVLIQNQVEGRKWRLTYLDFERSVASGEAVVLKVVDIDKPDELEGFTFLSTNQTGIAVTSSRKDNVHFINVNW
ncbi:hypothetical protein F0L74_02785 [Chitinophaga agrisoli]|uniref:Glutamine cyclotransferase n=1 Tax=Chitinophaga agrisoli TaxID=2607653 RepID=A0A5B2W322_9BACT|nr:hypothetical protein [Chitinophaga agrisoli]KAA2244906.1 hypothetical protein F0L74_02785 [Chitinophaga agrisoli]